LEKCVRERRKDEVRRGHAKKGGSGTRDGETEEEIERKGEEQKMEAWTERWRLTFEGGGGA